MFPLDLPISGNIYYQTPDSWFYYIAGCECIYDKPVYPIHWKQLEILPMQFCLALSSAISSADLIAGADSRKKASHT